MASVKSSKYPYTEDVALARAAIRRELSAHFAAIEELLQFADPVLDDWGGRKKKPALDQYTASLLALLARGSHTAHSIVVLCEHVFGSTAMMATRALFEVMLSAYWMSARPKLRAKQFAEFAAFERVKFAELANELGWFDGPAPLPRDLREPRVVRRLCNQFKIVRHGWTRIGSRQLVQDVGARWPKDSIGDFMLHARLVGALGNRHAHAGAEDTGEHLDFDAPSGVHVSLGPPDTAKTWCALALGIAAWTYGMLFQLCATELQLTDAAKWRVHFRAAMYRRVPVTAAMAAGVKPNDACPCGSSLRFKRCHRSHLTP